jgi:hypothetical protein
MSARLKIGLIVDDEKLSKCDYELVQWANSTEVIRVSHLIVQTRSRSHQGRSLIARVLNKSPIALVRTLTWSILWTIKRRMDKGTVAEYAELKDFAVRIDAGDAVAGRIFVVPQVSKSGFVHRFSEEDLGKIRDERFDLLIRAGTGILRGDILRSARLGVLSFHHGDNRLNRGGPAGFWEVYHGEPKTGFVVQRLTEELDGGDVVLRGFVPTQWSHVLNYAMLLAKSYYYLRKVLMRIAESGELPEIEEHLPYSGPLYVRPGSRQVASYILRRVRRASISRIRDLRGMKERWRVGFVKSHWRNAAFWRGKSLPLRPGHFLADPFVLTREGRTFVFVEDYLYRTRKAHISVFELGEQGAEEIGIALEEPYHLSFPYLFHYQGELFMCPETFHAHEIRIYRCTGFPLKWTLETVAMKQVMAADSMIFPHRDGWWLFTNLSESAPHLFSTELHIFAAADPLSGHWTPHRHNPVLINPDCARNGGMLWDGSRIFRVCQKQGFGVYGASARIREITTLNDLEYVEKAACDLPPGFRHGLSGGHHMHSDGLYTVWDYKRWDRSGD